MSCARFTCRSRVLRKDRKWRWPPQSLWTTTGSVLVVVVATARWAGVS
jgi:hypothetical protein